MWRADSLERTLMLGKIWGQEEKGTTEDEMVGWHHRLNGHGFGWTPGVGDRQGGLACYGSWGRKESDTTERLNWTETWEMVNWGGLILNSFRTPWSIIHSLDKFIGGLSNCAVGNWVLQTMVAMRSPSESSMADRSRGRALDPTVHSWANDLMTLSLSTFIHKMGIIIVLTHRWVVLKNEWVNISA